MSMLLAAIAEHATRTANAPAVGDGVRSLSYLDLAEAVSATADRLSALLPGQGPVALRADNSIAWIVIDLAFIRLARPLVPIPLFFTPAQQQHALEETGAVALISDTSSGHNAVPIDVAGISMFASLLNAKAVTLPAETAKITYTSGTTGKPKGVCLSQSGLEQLCLSLVEGIGTEYAGIHFAVLPLAVLLENVAGLYTTLIAGGRYLVLPQAEIGFGKSFLPDYGALAHALQETKATSIIVVPEILRGLMHAMASQQLALPDLRLVAVGGARVAPALLSLAELLGLPVYQGYGLSEAGSVVTLNTPSANRPGSAGKVLPHAPLHIADDGEIHVGVPAFRGYVGADRCPGRFATGDIGRIDYDGYLYIEGRRSNVVITSFGRNVSPEWVESELLAQPQIGQAFVFGEAHPALGALIVPASIDVTDAELGRAIQRANTALPEYAAVKHWSKAFPFLPSNQQLTANGRLRRAAIAEAHSDVIARCLAGTGQYTTFFQRLVSETSVERHFLMATPQIRDGLAGRISLDTYRLYLAQAYHHVKHTVHLLGRVRDRLPASKAWLRQAAEEYIAEETGHEEWILDDIRNAGGDAEAVRASAPQAATEFMVSFAYDYIDRINPVGFFGMVFVLEGTSTQLATSGAEALMKSLSLPLNCFRYLTSHGALDIGHMQFFQRLMDRIDDPVDQAAIIHMAKRMFVLFSNLFRSIPHDLEVQNAA
jgi:long-subunit acyl-CoA synthetase (AMP-forming)/pyrroloquinoline quinone (PQQ) biosynthesis protein C